MKKYNFTNEQFECHIKRVRETLFYDINAFNLPGIRISQVLWAIRFTNIEIIEVGTLQFQAISNSDVKIHIPKKASLKIEDVINSINLSKSELKKYFNMNNINYYCFSWLLSDQIREVINDDSNIAKFHDLFEIKDGDNGRKDLLEYIFNILECCDDNILLENTSLQKKIKKLLLEKKEIFIGLGKLVEGSINFE